MPSPSGAALRESARIASERSESDRLSTYRHCAAAAPGARLSISSRRSSHSSIGRSRSASSEVFKGPQTDRLIVVQLYPDRSTSEKYQLKYDVAVSDLAMFTDLSISKIG
jgi:hypothetical protein